MTAAGQFRPHQRVRISYPVQMPRYGYVVSDDGGSRVQVEWTAAKQFTRPGSRVLVRYPQSHVQWFPRERLEAL